MKEPAQVLAEGVNKLYDTSGSARDVIKLVRNQVDEIERRGQTIMKMQEIMAMQEESIVKLQQQNKHLEAMIEDLKAERQKLLEKEQTIVSARKIVSKTRKKAEDVTEAA